MTAPVVPLVVVVVVVVIITIITKTTAAPDMQPVVTWPLYRTTSVSWYFQLRTG